jgi:mannose-6-phosphate isomerase-like protein (cupin superfamily)
MGPAAEARVVRLSEAEPLSFGPLATYRKLTGEDGHPVFTGVQTCQPGYATPLHWHPYVESLFVLEGAMEAWTEGRQDAPLRLGPGEMVVLPAGTPHVFRNPGPGVLRILGIHASPTRIVNRIEAAG